MALAWGNVQTYVREGGGAALLGRVQVEHKGGHALATTAQQVRCAGLAGVEIVVVRLVFVTALVAQHLQAFAMFHGPTRQARQARFHTRHHGVFPALEKHALAGAGLVLALAPGVGFHGERARHAWARGSHQGIAFFGREHVAQQHHAWQRHRQEHLHLAIACIEGGGVVLQRQFGHGHAGGQALGTRQAIDLRVQHGLQGGQGLGFLPARLHQGSEQGRGVLASLGLGQDPLAQFGRDGGRVHASEAVGVSRRNTKRSGVDTLAHQA